MTTLQLSLVLIAIAVIVIVYLVNLWQERRIRRKLLMELSQESLQARDQENGLPTTKIEPILGNPSSVALDSDGFPLQEGSERISARQSVAAPAKHSPDILWAPSSNPLDAEVECVVRLQAAEPLSVAVIQRLLQEYFGKPARWFGWRVDGAGWEALHVGNLASYREIVGGLMLADRAGPLLEPQLRHFYQIVEEAALEAQATFYFPSLPEELERARHWDQFCAQTDLQIGLTILPKPGTFFKGSRLRGVCEAHGLRLNGRGQFEYHDSETGALLCVLVSRDENQPLQAETLAQVSLNGVLILLDVPRIEEPVKAYQQIKALAKRLAITLDGVLVDDNRRPLTDSALQQIQGHIDKIARALQEKGVIPGGDRANLLFN